ncbi:ABC transporter substrate-binding protein [Paenibacillus sp. FSL H8-0034]|uniref:ABC transporter substrate-binding protein n=1 Tax=Paenibacillus sp. FSL H8-0034 TaxID=2954671 RepID=UPI0030F7B23A
MRYGKQLGIAITYIMMAVLILACGSTGSNQASSSNPAPTPPTASAPTSDSAASGTKETAAAPQGSRIIKHDLGETTIQGTPQRIVVLELGFIDALLDVGLKPLGVADDNKPNLIVEDALKKIEGYTAVGMRAQPSLEKIKVLNPDLIIADTDRHKNVYAELSKIAPTLSLKNLNANYQETLDAAATIGNAVGKKSEMDKILETHKAKMKALQTKAAGIKKSVLLIGNTDTEMTVRHAEFFSSQLMSTIGFNYLLNNNSKFGTADRNVKMTIEQLLELDPDIIILMSGDVDKKDKDGNRPVHKDPLWQELKAVKTKQMFDVDRYAWSLRRSVQGANVMLDQTEKEILKLK